MDGQGAFILHVLDHERQAEANSDQSLLRTSGRFPRPAVVPESLARVMSRKKDQQRED
jgi:hypothetical protein